MNSISDRTQCTIAWLSVIILLRLVHVIFIEINVDKIINAFTEIFFVNFVNVYHICDILTVDWRLLTAHELPNTAGSSTGWPSDVTKSSA